VNGGGSEFLLDAIAVGGVFERGDGDDVDAFREGVAAAGDVIAASAKVAADCQLNPKVANRRSVYAGENASVASARGSFGKFLR